ncbi:MAG: hypothetical protein CMH55_09825 [Myxococcales bacterium]|nr:hypothetical protein [Myxococcales bacterium]
MKSLVLLTVLTAQPGQQVPGGERVHLPAPNCSIVVPKGWFGTLSEGGIFLIASHTHAGMMMVTWDTGSTDAGLQQFLSSMIPLDEMTALQPLGRASRRGKGYENTYTIHTDQGPMSGYARGRLLPGSIAFGVIAMGPPADLAKFKSRAAGIMKSLRLPSAKERQRQAAAFAGKRLKFYHTGGGLADRRRIDLCRDGSFRDYSSSSYYSNTPTNSFSAAGQGGASGRWRASGTTVTLVGNDGSQEALVLRRVGGKWMIGDQRWFVVDGDC